MAYHERRVTLRTMWSAYLSAGFVLWLVVLAVIVGLSAGVFAIDIAKREGTHQTIVQDQQYLLSTPQQIARGNKGELAQRRRELAQQTLAVINKTDTTLGLLNDPYYYNQLKKMAHTGQPLKLHPGQLTDW